MRADIAKWLPLFFEPDDVFEVRALDVDRPKQNYGGFVRGRDIDFVTSKIISLADRGGSIYFTPQKLNPNVLERSPAGHLPRITKDDDGNAYPRLAHDEDVTARRFLLIDVDPTRPPAFKKHSATDEEKLAALDVATATNEGLQAGGWPAPLWVDSGNGYHLYYRLPDAQVGGHVKSETDPVATLLRVLKAKFDTPAAEIDASVFNAARVMKVPGTLARKGPNTTDRPHRTSAVIEVPSDW